jgi:peptidoglycan/xylan/chitin deacetylase (PgdA/CDA1 family)
MIISLNDRMPTLCARLRQTCSKVLAVLRAGTILQPNKWPARSGKIVLTFDDGPNGDKLSAALLDVLQKQRVSAAFSLIGERVEAFPHIAWRIHRESHAIINHTHSHPRPLCNAAALDLEILRADRAIASALSCPGFRTRLFRPPYGLITPAVCFSPQARIRGRAHLTFYVDDAATGPADADQLMQRIKRQLTHFNGGAIVFHESRHGPAGSRVPDKSWLPSAIEELIAWAHDHRMSFDTYH